MSEDKDEYAPGTEMILAHEPGTHTNGLLRVGSVVYIRPASKWGLDERPGRAWVSHTSDYHNAWSVPHDCLEPIVSNDEVDQAVASILRRET